MSSIQSESIASLSVRPSQREATVASSGGDGNQEFSTSEIVNQPITDPQPSSQLVSTMGDVLGNLERNLSAHERLIRSNLVQSQSDIRPGSMASSTYSEGMDSLPPMVGTRYSGQFSSPPVVEQTTIDSLKSELDRVQKLMSVKDGRLQESLVIIEELSSRLSLLSNQLQESKTEVAQLQASSSRIKEAYVDQVQSLTLRCEELETQVRQLLAPKPDPELERQRQRELVLEQERQARQRVVDQQRMEILQARQRVMDGARMNFYKSPTTSTGKPVWGRVELSGQEGGPRTGLILRWGDWKSGNGGAAPPMTFSEPIVGIRSERVGNTVQLVFLTEKKEVRMALEDASQHKLWIDTVKQMLAAQQYQARNVPGSAAWTTGLANYPGAATQLSSAFQPQTEWSEVNKWALKLA